MNDADTIMTILIVLFVAMLISITTIGFFDAKDREHRQEQFKATCQSGHVVKTIDSELICLD